MPPRKRRHAFVEEIHSASTTLLFFDRQDLSRVYRRQKRISVRFIAVRRDDSNTSGKRHWVAIWTTNITVHSAAAKHELERKSQC